MLRIRIRPASGQAGGGHAEDPLILASARNQPTLSLGPEATKITWRQPKQEPFRARSFALNVRGHWGPAE
jgi:hypothetical protein